MRAKLTSRERVLRAIDHQDLDRVPCRFGAEDDLQARVREELGISDLLDITRHFGADTFQVGISTGLPDLTQVETVDDLDRLEWPGAHTVDVEGYARKAAEARATGLAVLGGVWASIFTGPRHRMGEAKFLMAMVDAPELVARLVERTADSYLEANEVAFARCARNLDVFYFGSDFGTQRSLFIGAEAFRRFFKPHMGRLAKHAKGFGLKVMFHTCGAVSEIIPDLVECGIDALDPVQVSARDMDLPSLAAQFKGKIAFHGGISTQTTLPHGTPEQVRSEVKAAIATLGPSGYICGPDQNMMGDTPIENIIAMYEAIHGAAP